MLAVQDEDLTQLLTPYTSGPQWYIPITPGPGGRGRLPSLGLAGQSVYGVGGPSVFVLLSLVE